MASTSSKKQELEILHEISTILNTGLDKRTLEVLSELIECGVNPEALADVVNQLRAAKASGQTTDRSSTR